MPLPPSHESSVDAVGAEACSFSCVLNYSCQDAAWIRVDGELDAASTPHLTRTLNEAMESARLVLVDLRGLTLIDGTGIDLLIKTDARTRRSGRRLVLLRDSTRRNRQIDLGGTSSELKVIDLGDFNVVRGPKPLAPRRSIR